MTDFTLTATAGTSLFVQVSRWPPSAAHQVPGGLSQRGHSDTFPGGTRPFPEARLETLWVLQCLDAWAPHGTFTALHGPSTLDLHTN